MRGTHSSQFNNQERDMHQLIYLVGLIVVILAILSFFGLR
jgi:Cu/Ag efflux pump CusA